MPRHRPICRRSNLGSVCYQASTLLCPGSRHRWSRETEGFEPLLVSTQSPTPFHTLADKSSPPRHVSQPVGQLYIHGVGQLNRLDLCRRVSRSRFASITCTSTLRQLRLLFRQLHSAPVQPRATMPISR